MSYSNVLTQNILLEFDKSFKTLSIQGEEHLKNMLSGQTNAEQAFIQVRDLLCESIRLMTLEENILKHL